MQVRELDKMTYGRHSFKAVMKAFITSNCCLSYRYGYGIAASRTNVASVLQHLVYSCSYSTAACGAAVSMELLHGVLLWLQYRCLWYCCVCYGYRSAIHGTDAALVLLHVLLLGLQYCCLWYCRGCGSPRIEHVSTYVCACVCTGRHCRKCSCS